MHILKMKMILWETAQNNKIDHIIKKLNLKPNQRVLDIGSGWGSLALEIAKKSQCEVVGITLSENQFEYSKKKVKEMNLENQVEFKLMDYRQINEKFDKVKNTHRQAWVISQWCTTGFLWYTWLSHDVANIAVFLPRQLSVQLLLVSIILLSVLLFYIFWDKGGRIQKVVYSKTGTRYTRSATIIDFVYAIILLYFKQYNDIPMSTTWVFVGLLCGRELAISTMNKEYKFKYVFPLIGKDFIKMVFRLSISVGIVLAIHYIIIPGGYGI